MHGQQNKKIKKLKKKNKKFLYGTDVGHIKCSFIVLARPTVVGWQRRFEGSYHTPYTFEGSFYKLPLKR